MMYSGWIDRYRERWRGRWMDDGGEREEMMTTIMRQFVCMCVSACMYDDKRGKERKRIGYESPQMMCVCMYNPLLFSPFSQ